MSEIKFPLNYNFKTAVGNNYEKVLEDIKEPFSLEAGNKN